MTYMNTKKILSFISVFIFIEACSIAPGMHMNTKSTWINDNSYVYIESLDKNIQIIDISDVLDQEYKSNYKYTIGNGDQIAVTVWGLPDIFPITNINQDQNLRRVDSNGNIFFPYVGIIKASGKTQNEFRIDLTKSLSKFFNEPQVDISISKFNSQQVFVLGEVLKPKKLNITDVPISLSDAIGESFGLNSNSADGSQVFVIRQANKSSEFPEVFHANLDSPASFISSGQFYLKNNDIVYVNSSGTARWNRVVSQFFPFSAFLNSVDNLTSN